MSSGSSESMAGVAREVALRGRKDGSVVEGPPKTASSMTRGELNKLVNRFNIPGSWGPRVALKNERIHSNFGGYFAVSGSFFTVGGMRLPYAPIIDEVCSTFGMLPSQIPPNSWRFMNGLALLCHQFGHPASVGVLRHFLRMSHSPSAGAGIPFLQYRDARYRPAKTPSKVSSWRIKYFFVKSPGSSSECRPWRYPLAEQWNDASTLSLSREEWEVIGRIKELGRYDFDRLIQGYPQGASAVSFLASPPPRISELKEKIAPTAMVRMGASGARASASGEQASQEKRSAAKVSEGAALLARLASSSVSASVPPAGDPPAELEPLPVVPVDPGQAASEEEEEDAGPSLKRKRDQLPPSSAGRVEAGKQSKGKGKGVVAKPGRWEPAITLSKDASIGDIEVSRYLAERVTPPVDERVYERKSNQELGSELVRLGMRVATVSFATVQRLETLDQEVQDLHEQTKGLKDELEGRDLLQAKNASLEEEKEALLARLAKAEEEREMERRDREMERKEREVERKDKEREVEEWKRTLREERELIKALRRDCHSAVVDRDRAVETLQEVRRSVRWQRVEAIKRWKRRFLYDESLELACDVSLGILKRGHQLYVPEGSPYPSFEDYARPLVPPELGLSLEGMMKRVEGEPTEAPDEELDLSSEEGEPRADVPSSPPGPTNSLVVLIDEEEPLAAFPGPVPLSAELPPSEASPERSPAAVDSPGYTPSPPVNV